jgi:hypothetical protein
MGQHARHRRGVKGRNRRGCRGVPLQRNRMEGPMETYDPHKSTTEVRQGSRRLDNFWVLVISFLAIVALFGIIYFAFFANTPVSAT